MALTYDQKRCTLCLEVKAVIPDFGFRGKYVKSRCRSCLNATAKTYRKTDEQKLKYRRTKVMKQYGLTPEEHDELFDGHDGLCAICRSDNPGGQYGKWSIDHDHATGKVRGLLCNNCNLGLGKFKDNMANLERAIAYLEISNGA